MTATTTDATIAARLSALTKARAAIPEDDKLPLSTTREQLAAIYQQRRELDARLATIRNSTEQLAALNVEADAAWLKHLNTWRGVLCDELLAIKSPIRDADAKARSQNLTFSIKLIDRGLSASTIGPVVSMALLRLGHLMSAAGYAVSGPELHGPSGWRGSVPEVEHRIKEVTRKRAVAQAALAEALLDDDTRAARDAESVALRAAFNSMSVRVGPDGRSLVAYRDDGTELPVSEMTELQRKALARMSGAPEEALR